MLKTKATICPKEERKEFILKHSGKAKGIEAVLLFSITFYEGDRWLETSFFRSVNGKKWFITWGREKEFLGVNCRDIFVVRPMSLDASNILKSIFSTREDISTEDTDNFLAMLILKDAAIDSLASLFSLLGQEWTSSYWGARKKDT